MTASIQLPHPRVLAGVLLWLALAALLAALPLAALAPAAAMAALLLWPPLLLVLVAGAVPFGGLAALQLGGARLTPALPLLALGAALALGRAFLAGRLPGWGPARPLLLPLACFLGLLALAGWRAPEAELVLQELGRWASLGLALWLAARLAVRPAARPAGTEEDGGRGSAAPGRTAEPAWVVAKVLALVLGIGALEAAWGIRGALLREGPEAYAALGGRILRAHGHFGQPNPFGGYMNQIWPLALAPLAARLLGLGSAAGDRRPWPGGMALPLWGGVCGALDVYPTAIMCGRRLGEVGPFGQSALHEWWGSLMRHTLWLSENPPLALDPAGNDEFAGGSLQEANIMSAQPRWQADTQSGCAGGEPVSAPIDDTLTGPGAFIPFARPDITDRHGLPLARSYVLTH
ncbi:MAG TPA: hypothetical protein PLZ56_12190, partial [Anaerolineae bacterium]|nr:hypothetical protein [Anaerolineae bacterium]